MRHKSIPFQISALGQVLSEANASGVSFLLTELDTALGFLEVAQRSNLVETVQRNHENALKAYRTIQRFLPKVKLDAAQQKEINVKLAILKTRLLRAGYLV